MRVLFIQKVKGLAGSENYFLELIPSLLERGVKCEFVSVRQPIDKQKPLLFNEKLESYGVHVHDVIIDSVLSLSFLRKLKGIISKGGFDIVHSHLIHADFWCALVKFIFRIDYRLVSTKHGYSEQFMEKYGFDTSIPIKDSYYWICKFSEKYIDKSFAVSEGLKQLFVDLSISTPSKIEVIHHGFNFLKKSEANHNFRFSDHQLLIVGRLLSLKGHKLLFDALLIIKDHYPDVILVVVGGGEMREELEEYVKTIGIAEHVIFRGFQEDIYSYQVSSDIQVVASMAEGFGLVLVEAFNAKVATIAFDVPACNEVIEHNKTGVLVAPYDTSAMASEIISLLDDDKQRSMLVTNAYQRLKSYFSRERMVNQTLNFYRSVLN
ncbi:glycosyltransferase family 4 protein [Limibacter armeniacum]|uniref:glycosyltransferase family 4 protein n=1 Tax=Limibacter armeniacum TaxID=466084 RepID=UPI002FE66092